MIWWLITALMLIVGLAHALASWVYFSRTQRGHRWLWTLGWIAVTVACIDAEGTYPWASLLVFAALVALWTIWWMAIRASATLEWVPENRHQATGRIVGDELIIRNYRNFDWQDRHRFTEQWEERTYDLTRLSALDLFVCTWGSPRIAHIMLSFELTDLPPLCFSIETRREVGERWTAFAGFMKSYELVMIAGDERDLVRSRVNIRGEDVRLYRVLTTPAMRRTILHRMVAQMNRLAARPRFYNTVFHNCVIEIALIIRAAGQPFPLDWRLLVSGYVAEYLYDNGLLDRSRPLADLKAGADVRARSRAADASTDYSRQIREGLPDPNASLAKPPHIVPG
jgi:hypothetical protein